MNKVLLVAMALSSSIGYAQFKHGVVNSAYAGATALQYSPTSMLTNRHRVSVELVGFNANVNNSAYEFPLSKIIGGDAFEFDANNTDESHASGLIPALNVSALNTYFKIGDKQALGISLTGNALVNIHNMDTKFLSTMIGNLSSSSVNDMAISMDRNFNINTLASSELGLSYARVLKSTDAGVLRLGATLKYLNGSAYSRFGGKFNGNYRRNNDNPEIDIRDADLVYKSSIENNEYKAEFTDNHGVGVNINMTYDWLADDGDYWLRADLGVNELGATMYKNVIEYSITGTGTGPVKLDDISLGDNVLTAFRNAGFTIVDGEKKDITVYSPTYAQAKLDLRAFKKVYVNLTGIKNVMDRETNAFYDDQVVLTPRYQSRLLDFGIPVQYNFNSEDVKAGVGIRLWAFVVGSDDLLGLIKDDTKGANVYGGLRFAFGANKSDKDDEPVVEQETVAPTTQPEEVSETPANVETAPEELADDIVEVEETPIVEEASVVEETPVVVAPVITDVDGDGVNDDVDACPTIAGDINNAGCPKKVEEVVKAVNTEFKSSSFGFETASDKLKPSSDASIESIAQVIKNSGLAFYVDGHADGRGDDAFNQTLSEKRAQSVVNALLSKGVKPEQLTARGFGETQPIADNATEKGRAQNRRVVIMMK